jgi:DNA-directed RNA polymerase subunit M/transcription elongation factor TFIIS
MVHTRVYHVERIHKIIIDDDLRKHNSKITNKLCRIIESSVYEEAIRCCRERGISMYEHPDFQTVYNNLLFEILYSMDPYLGDQNIYLRTILRKYVVILENFAGKLRQHLLSGIFPLEIVARLPPEMRNPNMYDKFVKNRDLRRNQKIETVYATHYRCTCGKNQTIVQSVQLRSFDEGRTDLIFCIACSRKWKVTG